MPFCFVFRVVSMIYCSNDTTNYRMRVVASGKAEAEHILGIKRFEGDVESKYLVWKGIIRKRHALVDG